MAIQNSNLPPSFVKEVVKIADDATIVRSNLKSVSDVYSWIEENGRTSGTKWNLRSSRPSGTRLVCCRILSLPSNAKIPRSPVHAIGQRTPAGISTSQKVLEVFKTDNARRVNHPREETQRGKVTTSRKLSVRRKKNDEEKGYVFPNITPNIASLSPKFPNKRQRRSVHQKSIISKEREKKTQQNTKTLIRLGVNNMY
ncbi:hypothetical protein AVEN_42419-1 [Araneus ventricosus]|uniref:Uncharacterized protein n=1 Tax=Araneus ventricosus TaxID=182803 RepID=A0A4Y2IME5_ARAVE|nr:hypothetical protein AVEN_42419-1 [Araneus ventricosus]